MRSQRLHRCVHQEGNQLTAHIQKPSTKMRGTVGDEYKGSRNWSQRSARREFFNHLKEKLQIKDSEDWYRVTAKDIDAAGGGYMFSRYYNNSLHKALSSVYPMSTCSQSSTDVYWQKWRMETAASEYWDIPNNQKQFFDWLAEKLKIERSFDWYKVKYKDIAAAGGKHLLKGAHKSSITSALTFVYPQFEWKEWLFQSVPRNFWANSDNQRKFLEHFAEEHGIETPDGWYKIVTRQVEEARGGHGVLNRYNGSLINALKSAFPEIKWLPWKFVNVTQRHWDDIGNVREYFLWLEEQLNIKELEDWYSVKVSDVYSYDGTGVLERFGNNEYGDALCDALLKALPERSWEFWKFQVVPRTRWEDINNQKQYMDWLKVQLNITKDEDWHRVTAYEIRRLKGDTLLNIYGGIGNLLRKFYPNLANRPRQACSKGQALLFQLTQKAFPHLEVIFNYKHTYVLSPTSMKLLEFDVYVPSVSLAMEYQGKHHFAWTPQFGDPEPFVLHDKSKLESAQRLGITLVYIPFWWDHTMDSLIATLHEFRPDLVKDPGKGAPIPKSMPPNFSKLKVW